MLLWSLPGSALAMLACSASLSMERVCVTVSMARQETTVNGVWTSTKMYHGRDISPVNHLNVKVSTV